MPTQTVSLHAGLLARKGEARPSVHGETFPARNPMAANDVLARREPVASARFEAWTLTDTGITRCIELPRIRTAPSRRVATRDNRRQVHARLEAGLHLRLKVAALRLGRTQQDLVASAMNAYLSFLDDDVFPPPSGVTNAGD